MQDEVYALHVYATTTTIGTNTQICFFIADSCVSEPVDSKSCIKKIIISYRIQAIFQSRQFCSPHACVYICK